MSPLATAGICLLAILVTPVAIIVIILLIDPLLRLGLPKSLAITNDDRSNERVFVLLGGAQTESRLLYPQLIPELRAYGGRDNSVLIADTGSARFDAKELVSAIAVAARGHKRVTFIAASMGLMLAHDAARVIRREGFQRVDAVSLDGITGTRDLKGGKFLALAWLAYLGPISNKLIAKRLWALTFRPIRPKGLTDLQYEQLDALWHGYRNYTLSKYMDQLRYIAGHLPLSPFPDFRVAVVQSVDDAAVLVPSELTLAHIRTIGHVVSVRAVHDTGHIALLDKPDEYTKAVVGALKSLD